MTGGEQRAQAGVHAGIGRRAVGQVLGVGGGDFARGEVGIDVRAFEGALGQDAHAVADVGGDFVQRQRREGVARAHGVGGGGEIGARVDERAVEVEDEKLGGFHFYVVRKNFCRILRTT